MKITQNFSYAEIFGNDFENLNKKIIENGEKFVKTVLQPARELLNQAINITSGYRSPDHNRAVNGARNSKHLYIDCGAADIIVNGLSGLELFRFFVENYHDVIGGIGLYYDENQKNTFIHVDNRAKNDGNITTWYFDGKNYLPIPEKYHGIFTITKVIKFI